MEKWDVHEWLEKAGLSQYVESFVDNGYDTPDLCAELQNDDLTAIGVTNKKHRSILFSKARELLNLLNTSEEATDAPAEEPKPAAAAISPGVLPTPSPTSPSSYPGGEYSEPWTSFSGFANGGGRIKMKKTGSGEKPPLPPPNKHKKKHPPPSPIATELPTFKREGGETGFTKLQLQLKIREELRAEGVVLSEPPYVDKEGQMCKPPLSELTERYSTKLKLQPLDIYDALCVIWNSENSFVTPLTPQQDQAHSVPHSHTVTLRGGSTETYEEPFDAARPTTTPDYIKHSPKEVSPKGSKCQTLPHSLSSSTENYDEPFDSVSKQQKSSKDSPNLKIGSPSKTLPSPAKLKPAAEEKDGDKKKSSADRESSPKHHGLSKLFRRVGNRRSQSIQEFDIKNRDDKKGAKKGAKISFPGRSKDALSLGKAQKRQNGASPRHSKHTESSSDADDSPQPTKVIELAKKFESMAYYHRPTGVHHRPAGVRPASIHHAYS